MDHGGGPRGPHGLSQDSEPDSEKAEIVIALESPDTRQEVSASRFFSPSFWFLNVFDVFLLVKDVKVTYIICPLILLKLFTCAPRCAGLPAVGKAGKATNERRTCRNQRPWPQKRRGCSFDICVNHLSLCRDDDSWSILYSYILFWYAESRNLQSLKQFTAFHWDVEVNRLGSGSSKPPGERPPLFGQWQVENGEAKASQNKWRAQRGVGALVTNALGDSELRRERRGTTGFKDGMVDVEGPIGENIVWVGELADFTTGLGGIWTANQLFGTLQPPSFNHQGGYFVTYR